MIVGQGPTVLTVLLVDLPSRVERTISGFDEVLVRAVGNDIATLIVLCEELAPCIVLMPESCVFTAGPTLLAELTRCATPTPVIAVADLGMNATTDLLHLGCSGIVQPDISPADLQRALHAVAAGELWFPRKVLSTAVRGFLSTTPNGEKPLTQREREILHLIGRGFKNREIADALFISRETVRWHVRSLNSKIGTHDRKRMTAFALAAAERVAS